MGCKGSLVQVQSPRPFSFQSTSAIREQSVPIETQTGTPIDLTSIDPSREWDTIADILAFVEKQRK
jgi:hypothetical protein